MPNTGGRDQRKEAPCQRKPPSSGRAAMRVRANHRRPKRASLSARKCTTFAKGNTARAARSRQSPSASRKPVGPAFRSLRPPRARQLHRLPRQLLLIGGHRHQSPRERAFAPAPAEADDRNLCRHFDTLRRQLEEVGVPHSSRSDPNASGLLGGRLSSREVGRGPKLHFSA
jgi:hypothetical protein